MSTDECTPKQDPSQTWTNADEVLAFIKDHPPGTRFVPGDCFVLPDVEQQYVVEAVRPFTSKGKTVLYLEMRATCAVEDCENEFLCAKTVTELREHRYVTRTCEEHRLQFKSPDKNAWKTSAYLAERERAERRAEAEQVQREVRPRTGPNEQAVLDVIEGLSLLRDRAQASEVVALAVGRIPPDASGRRDTRKQRVVRALESLRRDGRVTLAGGVVLL